MFQFRGGIPEQDPGAGYGDDVGGPRDGVGDRRLGGGEGDVSGKVRAPRCGSLTGRRASAGLGVARNAEAVHWFVSCAAPKAALWVLGSVGVENRTRDWTSAMLPRAITDCGSVGRGEESAWRGWRSAGGRISAFCSRAWTDPRPARRVDATVPRAQQRRGHVAPLAAPGRLPLQIPHASRRPAQAGRIRRHKIRSCGDHEDQRVPVQGGRFTQLGSRMTAETRRSVSAPLKSRNRRQKPGCCGNRGVTRVLHSGSYVWVMFTNLGGQ
jgi:hypothetical protein